MPKEEHGRKNAQHAIEISEAVSSERGGPGKLLFRD
jgi:hypothetical protein